MIILENVTKQFGTGVLAVSDLSLSVEKGEFVFLVGPTGSGKTTIFRMLIREMIPSQGKIVVNNLDVVKLPGKKVPELRKSIGVIFQDLKLLPDRTVLENIMLPLELVGVKPMEAKKRSEEVLNQVGILEHADKFPVQLSGGERQRAAIARALILSPAIILADEPTGDLDDDTAWEIVEILENINASGTTIVMATHNKEILKKLDKRVVELDKGSLINDKNPNKSKEEHKHHVPSHEKHEVETKTDSSPKNITDNFEEALKEKK
jgi:cell division transport system ATP-binding protein